MKAETKNISEALSRQIYWLQTWKTNEGAYNGYVVHRHDLKRMFKIHDTPWSQGPIIEGYLNLYKKTKNNTWIQEAIQSADLQCKRLHVTGKYIYAGFEDDRFSSLVHNSLANCALLDLAKVLIDGGSTNKAHEYLRVAKENVDRYIIGVLWDDKFGAFRFSEVDYYTPDVIRFVVNMNSVAAESLVKLASLTGGKKYQDYLTRIGSWILKEQFKSSGLENGGINYSQAQPGILISIYTALSMRGLDDLYGLTGDNKYLEMMENAAGHLINLVDSESHFFYHAILNGRIVKYPQFIAGSGIILKALRDTEQISKNRYDYKNTLHAILEKQLDSGGISNFIGYNSNDNYREKGDLTETWEDAVPVVGWNAHLFEFLTSIVQQDYVYEAFRPKKVSLGSKNYFYLETRHYVFILGIRPIKSLVLFFAIKKANFALFYITAKPFLKLAGALRRFFKPKERLNRETR